MIRATAFAAALMAVASPALSLSCMRPDVASSYSRAADAEESYLVVHGTLKFNESKLPKSSGNDSPPTTRIKAHMTGNALSQSGFNHPFDRDITLEVQCLGPWCGGAVSGIPYLAFIRKDGAGYTFAADPCGSLGFAKPTPKMLAQAEQCMNGGACKPGTR